ncbi:hypothetical protein [Streptococcus sp.]|uniref:hypothetical protein n=1 Tax=Streptococcus sp. TaxID=1306 RepID=UPI00359FE45A
MKFKKRQLNLHHLAGFDATVDPEGDIFENVVEVMAPFKQFLIENGCYFDGPLVYKYNPYDESGEFLIMVPIGNEIEVLDDSLPFFYQEEFNLTTDYYYRHYNQDEEFPYKEIEEKIAKDNCTLMTIYHVVLDLCGDQVTDLYCEVSENL